MSQMLIQVLIGKEQEALLLISKSMKKGKF